MSKKIDSAVSQFMTETARRFVKEGKSVKEAVSLAKAESVELRSKLEAEETASAIDREIDRVEKAEKKAVKAIEKAVKLATLDPVPVALRDALLSDFVNFKATKVPMKSALAFFVAKHGEDMKAKPETVATLSALYGIQ